MLYLFFRYSKEYLLLLEKIILCEKYVCIEFYNFFFSINLHLRGVPAPTVTPELDIATIINQISIIYEIK